MKRPTRLQNVFGIDGECEPTSQGGDGLDAEHQRWLLGATQGVAAAESKLREAFLLVGGDPAGQVSAVKSEPRTYTSDKSPVVKALAIAVVELVRIEAKIAADRQAREE